MKNLRIIIFFLLLGAYAVGVFIGGVRQIKTDSPEMYEYLSGALSQYAPAASESIKGVAGENAKLLAVLAIAGIFKGGILLSLATLSVKGYSAGFAITAALRLYGLKGFLVCGANIFSVLLIIPAAAYYGSTVFANLVKNRFTRGEILKKYFFMLIFLTAIFCIDSLLRGFLSSIFMKFSEFFTKTA